MGAGLNTASTMWPFWSKATRAYTVIVVCGQGSKAMALKVLDTNGQGTPAATGQVACASPTAWYSRPVGAPIPLGARRLMWHVTVPVGVVGTWHIAWAVPTKLTTSMG